MAKILIVEDDKRTNMAICEYLKPTGHNIVSAYDGEEALQLFHSTTIDLIVLDIMLPRLTGIAVLHEIRKSSLIPVLMLTAIEDEYTQSQSFDELADDYVTKPFSIIELVARIKANIRRATKYINVSHEEEIIQIKDLKIYTDQHKVERGGKIINLTHTEFEILVLLASNPGRAFSKEEMYLKIWNEPYYGNERVLNSHMNRLRGKLNIDNSNKMDYIQTLWGIGYKMEK